MNTHEDAKESDPAIEDRPTRPTPIEEKSRNPMKPRAAVILGIFILLSALCHGLLFESTRQPKVTGRVRGEVWAMQNNGVAHDKYNGCQAERFENFVILHVDKNKEPTWTDDYVLTFFWTKIERLTLLPGTANAK